MKLEDAPAKRSKVHTVYRLADGTKVPGVTTVLGVINKPQEDCESIYGYYQDIS